MAQPNIEQVVNLLKKNSGQADAIVVRNYAIFVTGCAKYVQNNRVNWTPEHARVTTMTSRRIRVRARVCKVQNSRMRDE